MVLLFPITFISSQWQWYGHMFLLVNFCITFTTFCDAPLFEEFSYILAAYVFVFFCLLNGYPNYGVFLSFFFYMALETYFFHFLVELMNYVPWYPVYYFEDFPYYHQFLSMVGWKNLCSTIYAVYFVVTFYTLSYFMEMFRWLKYFQLWSRLENIDNYKLGINWHFSAFLYKFDLISIWVAERYEGGSFQYLCKSIFMCIQKVTTMCLYYPTIIKTSQKVSLFCKKYFKNLYFF